jgi:hypothetical protein
MERNWAIDAWVILVNHSKGIVHTQKRTMLKLCDG